MVRGRVKALAVAGLVTVALSMGPATAETRVKGEYVGALPIGTPNPSVGGAHFIPPAGTSTMDVWVKDQFTKSVAFHVVFVVDYLDVRYSRWFCSSKRSLPVPPGTDGIDVRVDGMFFKCGTPSIPTRGTISVIFR